ncbi:UDP-2,4-diacetamido-2,4,6-trideoxy-beta-L-altropyranose hydrolase [Cytobacillus dafuensis]|uniref:UDP-2,4-diacetamido-2,4, 6-trideoxy-beta-L-altropyranose hydrolase n=1 Tax=Cytobacillus dafuensis TaxID=1742359 RepID=A0A5B8Z8C5_CYTDA|nr:UDP-2,4-diacetamido-2,4,6-trideoxy-beta-L-altropyranose hydrolase [Cytobacillus dafuensis]QED49200.1 UDP-2,4-diacetamido-2,4,6-trideoxy-beta-L-altropyranose hydrolase [Cytobacillus dafuensis]
MRYVFRVDASFQMGTGHVMRCLIIADELKKQHQCSSIIFICREFQGNMIDFIMKKGYQVRLLPSINSTETANSKKIDSSWLGTSWENDAKQTIHIFKELHEPIDWIIIDHYGIDSRWQKEVKEHVNKIMVIDDLANRSHFCDVILDQNFYHDYNSRYDSLVPKRCIKLLGPDYVLLRPEFMITEKKAIDKIKKKRKIFISFGGADPTNETEKALNALKKIKTNHDLEIDVVVGKGNPHKERIKRICDTGSFRYFCQVNNIAQLMADADLAIGAGGISIYERLYMGLPSITISTADNQTKALNDLALEGYVYYLGESKEVSEILIENTVLHFLLNRLELKRYEFNERSNFLWEQLQNPSNNQQKDTDKKGFL